MIEMMLATFAYPLLLQPLLLYCQRLNAALDVPDRKFSEGNPLGGIAGEFAEAERNLAPFAGPARTALFSIASVFYFLTNPPLLRLLATALLHPLSPDSSGVPTLRSTLEVSTKIQGRQSIRVDRHTSQGKGDRSTYAFGTTPGNRRVSKMNIGLTVVEDGGEACVFVLSPALAEVLEFRGEDSSLIARTRPNQYRRALLQFLDTPAGISDVQCFAFHTLDAIFTALDSKFASDVMFGTDLKTFSDDIPADERTIDSVAAHSSDDRGIGGGAAYHSRKSLQKRKGGPVGSDLMNEVVPPLCRSVIHAVKQPLRTSEWKLEFDEVAAHALLCAVRCNDRATAIAAKTMGNLWRAAAMFFKSVPHKIPPPMGGSTIPMIGTPSVNDPDYDELVEGYLMNYIFYDEMESSDDSPVVDRFLKLGLRKEERDAFSVSVTRQSNFDSLCSRVGAFLIDDIGDSSVSLLDKKELQLVRHDAYALMKLNAIGSLLNDMSASGGGLLREADMAGIAVASDGTIVDVKKETFIPNLMQQIHCTLSSSLINCLFYDETLKVGSPATGSMIDMSGKPLLPCVCEVAASLSHLFTSSSSGVVAEGVTWQSLYLVLTEDCLILVQPQLLGGELGEGRVITSCKLERLTVLQDAPSAPDAGPPARRLLLFHKWIDPKPPTFLMFDAMPEYEEYGPFVRARPFTSSVDVWFEDQATADNAYQILSSQIFAAKSRRGRRVEKFLSPNQNEK